MGRNLTNLYISESFQYLTQISGSELQTGLGQTLTGSLLITASKADTATSASFATTASYVASVVSASYAVSSSFSSTSTSASYALTSTSSSFATNANSASYATTSTSASFATNANTASNTPNAVVTASAAGNTITFTKGDNTTFNVSISQTGSVASASYALSASYSATATSASYSNNSTSASYALVSTTSSYANNATSASYALTASYAANASVNTGSFLITASISNATTTYTKGDGSTFALTTNNVVNANSASVATSASFATTAVSASYSNNSTSASYALNATSASFASTIPNGLSPTFANVTASNVLITGTASVAFLNTTTISSSVIFTSGSNQLGDNPSLDTQTLFGAVKVTGSFASTGSAGFTGGDFKVTDQTHNGEFDVDLFKVQTQTGTQFTGSVSSQNGFTGSLQGTASYASNALSSSYSNNSTSASYAATSTSSSFAINATSASYAVNSTSASYSNNSTSASYSNNATSASYAITASYAANAPASSPFPFSGSAVITGSLLITGSSAHTLNVSGSNILVGGVDEGKQATVGIVGSRYGFAGGWLALSSMTGTDRYNIAIGGASMYNATTVSDRNVCVGSSTLGSGDYNSSNVAVGMDAMSACSNSNQNVYIGEQAGLRAQGSYNVGIGWNAGRSEPNTGFGYNTTIGWYSMGDAGGANCYGNVALGYTALRYASRYYNTAIGAYALDQLTTGEDNTVVGLQAGHNLTTGSRNVFLGRYAGYNETASDRLHIANTQSYSLIYGEFDNRLVKINGDLQVVSGSVSGSVITNATSNYSASKVDKIVTLTQAEYNGLTPNANTLYVISGSTPNATIGSNTFIGNQIVTGSVTATLGFTGSLLGTASFANTATTASYVLNAVSSSFASTASFYSLAAVTQNAVFSGSVRGDVEALSISSNTASLDCSTGNFFTLTLVSGSTTFVNPSNILPGQTINLRVKQASVASGSISFASSVKQVSGSAYTPTATANGEDIVTFISFDSTNLYLSNVKNFV